MRNATPTERDQLSSMLQVGTVFCIDLHEHIDQLPMHCRQVAWLAVINYAETRLLLDFQDPPKRSVLARLFDWPVSRLPYDPREARPGEFIVGHAGSLFSDSLVIYTPGTKQDGVIVRFKDQEQQWDAYCNDVSIEVGPDGYAKSCVITNRCDGVQS